MGGGRFKNFFDIYQECCFMASAIFRNKDEHNCCISPGPILAGVQRVHRTRAAKTRGGRRPHIVLSIKQIFLKLIS